MLGEANQSPSLQFGLEGGFREVTFEIRTYIARFLSSDLNDRLVELAKLKAAEANPRYRSCLSSTCDSGQVHYGGKFNNPVITCKACGRQACFNHGVPWHEGYTCDEYVSGLLTAFDPLHSSILILR